jgi:hypothetical protein
MIKCALQIRLLLYLHINLSGWSEKFSASTTDSKTTGKISFPSVGTSVISIYVKLQFILSSSLFYTAV